MSKKMTPILLAVALAIGVITYVTDKASRSQSPASSSRGDRVLEIDQADIVWVRVKRDYWNSFALRREADGTWQVSEPSVEPAAPVAVTRLLGAIENLPVVRTIDLPATDSERYREYGLWEPAMEVTVTAGDRDRSLVFGINTPDGTGTYCAEAGVDRVYVTSSEAAKILGQEYAAYRQNASPAEAALPSSSGGLKIEELAPGSGPGLHVGQTAYVQYTGRLSDGTVFDSSLKRGKPSQVKLGAGKVIPGWEQGLLGMKVGGKRRLTIPPELAYGPAGKPPTIPPNATLTFEVQVLSVSDKPAVAEK